MRKLHLFILSLSIVILCLFLYKKIEKNNEIIVKPEITQPKNTEPEIKKYSFEDVVEEISEEEIKKNLEYLASDQLEGRMSGKKGNKLAADFVEGRFKEFGLPVIRQRLQIKRLNPGPQNETGDDYTENVCAWIEGTDFKDQIIIIGAHMDHIGYGPSMSRSGGGKIHPGADDNASGTVALLQIAKAFSKLKDNKRTVVFIAFSAEELGLLGSKHYCDSPLFPLKAPSIRDHVFMLNMDMVGYLNKGKHAVSFTAGESSLDVKGAIEQLAKKYNFAENITSRKSGGSDHAPFYNKGIPIAFLHTGLHDHYHKPSDTADKINYEGLTKVSRYAFELAWAMANCENRPAFDYGSFEEMELTHDHGQKEFPEQMK